jgi:hypothetical protein
MGDDPDVGYIRCDSLRDLGDGLVTHCDQDDVGLGEGPVPLEALPSL